MNVAMISTWHVHAEGYAEQLQAIDGVTVAAVWDADPAKGAAWANKLGCRFEADYSAILADGSIDGIVMCAPTNEHAQMLLAAVAAGKHIFTEKVLALTTQECAAIRTALQNSSSVFTISFPHMCRPELQFVKSFVESGELGQITYARVRNAHNGASANWLPAHFYSKTQCGGGAMMDLGAHPMYLLQWYLGEPKTVQSCFTFVTGKEVEDNAVSVLSFADGIIGVSETGFVSENSPFQLEICGTKGTVMVNGDQVQYATQASGGKWIVPETLPAARPKPLEQWVTEVKTGEKSDFGIELAVALTRLMQGAYTAAATGQVHSF